MRRKNSLVFSREEAPMPAVVTTDWREEYAYTLGLQAYIYGFPWVLLPHLRWQWVTQPVDPDTTPYAPLNHFWHRQSLMDAQYRDGGSPNTDSLYSIAWLDLRQEPVILSHPHMGARSFTFELTSLDADIFASVGTRTSGQQAGHYAIVGPGWQGHLPPGVQALAPSRTPSVLLCGCTQVDGPTDMAQGRALLKHYRLTPLSRWGQPGARAAQDHRVWQPCDPQSDPLATWKTMNRAMSEEPPEARHAALLKVFATIGLGPHQQVEEVDAATQRGLARAAQAGPTFLAEVCAQGGPGKHVNGWLYPPPTLGRAGQHDDFLTRAAWQCAAGILAHDPQEALCLTAYSDGEGQPLSGSRDYRLHFAPEGLPPVQACWSITLYGADHNLVENPIERYAIGDCTPELLRDPDGGLTLLVQHDPPADDEVSNWLPAPKGAFNLILRAYLPARQIVAQTWQPPALQKRKCTVQFL